MRAGRNIDADSLTTAPNKAGLPARLGQAEAHTRSLARRRLGIGSPPACDRRLRFASNAHCPPNLSCKQRKRRDCAWKAQGGIFRKHDSGERVCTRLFPSTQPRPQPLHLATPNFLRRRLNSSPSLHTIGIGARLASLQVCAEGFIRPPVPSFGSPSDLHRVLNGILGLGSLGTVLQRVTRTGRRTGRTARMQSREGRDLRYRDDEEGRLLGLRRER